MTFLTISRTQKRFLGAALAALAAAALAGCAAQPKEKAYESAYQSYRVLCVMPAEEHNGSLDLALMRTLADRGFEPKLLGTADEKAAQSCRAVVTFSTGGSASLPLETPPYMSLSFIDMYTGETYFVSEIRRGGRVGRVNNLFTSADLTDPAVSIRSMVEKLFPRRPLAQ